MSDNDAPSGGDAGFGMCHAATIAKRNGGWRPSGMKEVTVMGNESKRIGWGTVLAAMIGIGLVVGLAFGLLGAAIELPTGLVIAGIGVTCGLIAPLLISRMRPTI
jgi:hypothetical protein